MGTIQKARVGKPQKIPNMDLVYETLHADAEYAIHHVVDQEDIGSLPHSVNILLRYPKGVDLTPEKYLNEKGMGNSIEVLCICRIYVIDIFVWLSPPPALWEQCVHIPGLVEGV